MPNDSFADSLRPVIGHGRSTYPWVVPGVWAALLLLLHACGPAGDSQGPGVPAGSENSTGSAQGELVIHHDTCLTVPFQKVADLFMGRNPKVKIKLERAGTRDAARTVLNAGGPWDVVGSSDYRLVEELLIPDKVAYTIRFARDEMVLAYTDQSRYGDEITAANWPNILLRSGVNFGRVDLSSGPAGYRALMMFDLASLYFRVQTVGQRLKQPGPGKVVGPLESGLVRMLREGTIDYLPMLGSDARRQELKALAMPGQVNLAIPEHADLYRVVRVKVDGRQPGETITLAGAPIAFSVALAKGSQAGGLAEQFVALLLSAQGAKILSDSGLQPITPPQTDTPGALPAALAGLCGPKK